MLLSILKAIIAWLVLMLVGTNLIGHIVRGLVHQDLPHEDEFDSELVKGIARRTRRGDTVLTVGWMIVGLVYLYVLFHWWNLAVAIAALVIMLTRLPDLLFEIKMGLSYSAQARKLAAEMMPNRPLGTLCTAIDWLALPLLWWGLSQV